MVSIDALISRGRDLDASDLHLHAGLPPVYRVDGRLVQDAAQDPLQAQEISALARAMLEGRGLSGFAPLSDVDFCYVSREGGRQRVNLYYQDGVPGAAVRFLQEHIPTFSQLGLPPVLQKLTGLPRGLVLVTGPTGSGKSTTLAAMLGEINRTRACHILTLEDPVEYRHECLKSVVDQREVGLDTPSFAHALRSALREDPDVILVGEMRDPETIAAAVTAAETGHLVFSTLHTTSAPDTVDRIIDAFPAAQQGQIRIQLSSVLRAVITQTLLPRAGQRGRVAAFEILIATDAVANLIREGKTHQIPSAMQTGAAAGMTTLAADLARLVRGKVVAPEAALAAAKDANELRRMI